MKKVQNFENHTQHDQTTYILWGLVIVLWIFLAILAKKINAVVPLNWLQYFMPIFVPILLLWVITKARMYSTKLQDRIIRQEVQFRYFVATWKTLPESITLSQIVWLRFAWDSEFIALVNKIVENPSLTSKEIKKHIKNWKWDFNRV